MGGVCWDGIWGGGGSGEWGGVRGLGAEWGFYYVV